MFTEPLYTTSEAANRLVFGTLNLDGQKSVRRSDGVGGIPNPVGLQIGTTTSKENSILGGSYRHLVRLDTKGFYSDLGSGIISAESAVQLVIMHPVMDGTSSGVRIATVALVQALVSFLLGETDGTLSADATIDATVIDKIMDGEP